MFPEQLLRNYLNDLVGFIAGGLQLMPNWSDQETPSGTVNGINTSFSLANPPSPLLSLMLVWNGAVLRQGTDYTLSGQTITYITPPPGTGDIVESWYRYATSGSTVVPNFGDQEVPSGTINGVNAIFTLANSPSPAFSLILVLNGMVMIQGFDYVLVGAIITFVSQRIPQTSDSLEAWYRF